MKTQSSNANALPSSCISFQDYNAQVLSSLTAPNVAANLARLPPGGLRRRPRYYAGGWVEEDWAFAWLVGGVGVGFGGWVG